MAAAAAPETPRTLLDGGGWKPPAAAAAAGAVTWDVEDDGAGDACSTVDAMVVGYRGVSAFTPGSYSHALLLYKYEVSINSQRVLILMQVQKFDCQKNGVQQYSKKRGEGERCDRH